MLTCLFLANPHYSQMSDDFDNISAHLHDEDSQDNNSTIDTASFMDGDDGYGHNFAPGSRKRKRPNHQELLDQQHTMYADALLDYFILSSSEIPTLQTNQAPYPPDNFQVDRPIDDQGHTALHWGAAMGDIEVARHFLDRRANPGARNNRGETPLIRAVLFTNNYEKESMPRLVNLLLNTIRDSDDHGANVLHHIVMTTNSHAKRKCARYYLDVVLNKLAEYCSPSDFNRVLNHQDGQGDTALHIAARHNAKKCVRALQGRGVRGDILNSRGETADHILQSLRSVHQDFVSSSPVLAQNDLPHGQELVKMTNSGPIGHYHTQPARSFSQSFESMAQEKSLQLSLALDSELRDKEEDLADSQRMLEKLENERHSVRQAMFLNFAQSGAENDDEVRALEEEEAELKAEGLALSEQIQHKELHPLVRAEEKRVASEAQRQQTKPGGGGGGGGGSSGTLSNADIEEQIRASLDLAAEQSKRRKLTNMVVEAQSSAGMSQTGEALKRLVSSTTAVPPDQVVELVPELLEELEQAKMDFSSADVAVVA